MKTIAIIFSLVISFGAIATTVAYEDPPNACYENCTPWMLDLLHHFENRGALLKQEPAVYSGECRHLGQYDPNHSHYAMVMIDQLPNSSEFYFSTIFTYFAAENEFQNWDLTEARKNSSDYWKTHGQLIQGRFSTRVEVNYDDGSPAYIYWMRQDPATQSLYYITYSGTVQKSFCHLQRH
jgi:hypothetical protein